MTYVYADSTAVLGPLALASTPGGYDLCEHHAERTSVPRGWEVIRLPLDDVAPVAEQADADDLVALAAAVRAIGLRHDDPEPPSAPLESAEPVPATQRQRGHLRLVTD